MTSFSSLGLAQPILDALVQDGYETPTPIQAQSIPVVLDGTDLLGCAQTGTGKTASFALPVIHRLQASEAKRTSKGKILPRALVLSPTRELATQIAENFKKYCRYTDVSGTIIYGGVKQSNQVRDLRRGIDVIVATPGRLMDLMEQGHVDLSGIEVFILDEADRMLDMGFIHPIRKISSQLPKQRQTLLFSATMPKEIARLAGELLTDPVHVTIKPKKTAKPKIEESLYMVETFEKAPLLSHFLEDEAVERAVVFTKTKHGADKLTKVLSNRGVSADSIHGNKTQSQRQRALDSFRTGRSRVLVATDVAARGLDVDGVTHVFNFNLPNEPEAYVHRIGRTGRAGATGIAISFCDRSERKFLRAIERLTGNRMPPQRLPEQVEAEHPDRPRRTERSAPHHDDSHQGGFQDGHNTDHRQPRAGANQDNAPHDHPGHHRNPSEPTPNRFRNKKRTGSKGGYPRNNDRSEAGVGTPNRKPKKKFTRGRNQASNTPGSGAGKRPRSNGNSGGGAGGNGAGRSGPKAHRKGPRKSS